MQYKLLASDYDNTLVPFGEHFPRPAVVKAVKKMQAAGGKFVLSTGRAWSAVNRKGQLGGIRFDYAITCNGACVLDREGHLKACYDHMNAPGLECIDGEDQDRHLIDMPHAAFAVLPSAALEEFNKKYGHLDLHWMQVGGEMPGGWCSFDIVRGGIDKGVGMANGTPEAKAAAKRVIGDVREDGLAALIEELWFDGPKAEPSGKTLGSPWEAMEEQK